MSQLVGKLALITGAASGIGLSSARLFARNGADLALVDLSENVSNLAKEIQENVGSSVKISSHILDVTSKPQVESLFKKIKETHKNHQAPNVILNSAGIARVNNLTNISEQEYDEIINVNLKGTFIVTQAAIKLLVDGFTQKKFENITDSYASIINLSSQAGKHGAAFSSHYAITKAGLIGFSKSISREFGPYRIRCNSVLPFFIDTPMVDSSLDEKSKKGFKKLVPLQRFGKPEEVANLCLFLASDLSSYVNGASIDINGGF